MPYSINVVITDWEGQNVFGRNNNDGGQLEGLDKVQIVCEVTWGQQEKYGGPCYSWKDMISTIIQTEF